MTEEKIKQFEEDVKNGKEIKVENYVVNIKKDYSNKISNFGKKVNAIKANIVPTIATV